MFALIISFIFHAKMTCFQEKSHEIWFKSLVTIFPIWQKNNGKFWQSDFYRWFRTFSSISDLYSDFGLLLRFRTFSPNRTISPKSDFFFDFGLWSEIAVEVRFAVKSAIMRRSPISDQIRLIGEAPLIFRSKLNFRH